MAAVAVEHGQDFAKQVLRVIALGHGHIVKLVRQSEFAAQACKALLVSFGDFADFTEPHGLVNPARVAFRAVFVRDHSGSPSSMILRALQKLQ